MGVFFNDSISNVIPFNVGNQKQFECHYLSPARLSSAISSTYYRSQVWFILRGGVCGWMWSGLCLKKATVQGALEWGFVQMGCIHMACLLVNPLAWSRSVIDEMCSHIQQLTPEDSSLTLTGWHWSCTNYFSLSPIFLPLSFSCSFPDTRFFLL